MEMAPALQHQVCCFHVHDPCLSCLQFSFHIVRWLFSDFHKVNLSLHISSFSWEIFHLPLSFVPYSHALIVAHEQFRHWFFSFFCFSVLHDNVHRWLNIQYMTAGKAENVYRNHLTVIMTLMSLECRKFPHRSDGCEEKTRQANYHHSIYTARTIYIFVT